jgi:hypothetical protein
MAKNGSMSPRVPTDIKIIFIRFSKEFQNI